MSSQEYAPLEAEVEPVKEKEGKKRKEKKRPSDFEIVRTILQRTHERRLPYLLKDMEEDSDIYLLCSEDEEGFTYGSPDLSIALISFDDLELLETVKACLSKLYGLKEGDHHQRTINLRDQISELAKTKGESMEIEASTNEAGSAWVVKTDIRGQEKTTYFCKAIDSLYHMQMVKYWCKLYRPLLTTHVPDYLYYPYKHPEGDTCSIVSFPKGPEGHLLSQMYPSGFRAMVSRGIDVILTKFFVEHFPYGVESEEMIIFSQDSTYQMAHRVIGKGWRMVLLRPNAIYFPAPNITLPSLGHHNL